MEKKNDSPLVDVVFTFRTGAASDPAGKKGLAQLTAAMLADGGSEFRDIETLNALYYPIATDVAVTVDKEMTKFSATVHRDNLEKWWQVFGEQLINPGFRQDDLERIKQTQINGIRVGLRSNNDEELGKEALYQMVYGPDHAYGTLNLGKAADVQKLGLEDVRNFYRQNYGRGRMVVSIAGNYDDKVLRSMLSATMRLRQDDYNRIDAKAPPVATSRSAMVIQKETPAVAVSFGIPLDVKRGDADWAALWLARSWLGEHRSSAGRLYRTIREDRGMNYGDYAYIEYFPAGMFRMQPGTGYVRQNDLFQIWLRPLRTNNDAVFATRAALREVENLAKKGMSREDFEASRAFLKKFAVVLTAAQRDELGYAIDSELNGTKDFVAYVTKALDELTLEKVNDALKRRIKPEGFQFVFVSADAAGLARQLSEGKPSPITYNTPKPALAADDKVIASYPLGLKAANVKVVKADTLFE
jgi:zinc protease